MCSSLASGKSATPPARCIHRPQRDTSSAGYRLLVSLASAGASRELSSRRSPALAPHTCAVSPTFRYGAFFFAPFALADLSSTRLTAPTTTRQIRSVNQQQHAKKRNICRSSPPDCSIIVREMLLSSCYWAGHALTDIYISSSVIQVFLPHLPVPSL